MTTVMIVLGVLVIGFLFLMNKSVNRDEANKNTLQDIIETLMTKHNLNLDKHFKSQNNTNFVGFDQSQSKILIATNTKQRVVGFKDILDCAISIDGQTIEKSSTSKIVAGEVLAGGVGAVIGATMKDKDQQINAIGLTVTLNDLTAPTMEIIFDSSNEAKNYKSQVEEWHGIFKIIMERNREGNMAS